MDLSEAQPEFGNPPKKVCSVCAVCQAPADKSCGACHQIYYCSIEHQKSHWKVHKKDCPPIKIVSSPELGPHFIATHDLLPGALLLTELPVLAIPCPRESNDEPPSCFSCSSVLPSTPWACHKCSAPFFCNVACSMNMFHSEFECGIFSKCNTEQKGKLCFNSNRMYRYYLRAMGLKNRDPETWSKVIELHGANHFKPEDANENDKWFIQEILPLCSEKGMGFEGDMFKLKGILLHREIAEPRSGISPKEDNGVTLFLYLKASNFARSCFPNCTPIIGRGPQFQMKVQTTVVIKKGTILSMDYVRISAGLGVMKRQHIAINNGSTLCICPRCSDPSGTELGTMLSAVKCTEPDCRDGYLLPVDTMNMAENAPWRCNRRSSCTGKGSTWGEIDGFIKKLEDEMEAFLPSIPWQDVERTADFLESLKKKLHPNHWRVIYFQNDRIKQLFFESGSEVPCLSVPQLRLYLSLIEDILRMAEFTAPGLSMHRARLWDKHHGLLLKKLLWGKLPKELEEEFKRRALEGMDQFWSIAKFFPETWPAEHFEHIKIIRTALQPDYNLRELWEDQN